MKKMIMVLPLVFVLGLCYEVSAAEKDSGPSETELLQEQIDTLKYSQNIKRSAVLADWQGLSNYELCKQFTVAEMVMSIVSDEDDNMRVRKKAVEALGGMLRNMPKLKEDRNMIKSLAEMISEKKLDVLLRSRVVKVVSHLITAKGHEWTAVIKDLETIAASDKEAPPLRMAAIVSLGRVGKKTSLVAITKAISSRNKAVKVAALNGLVWFLRANKEVKLGNNVKQIVLKIIKDKKEMPQVRIFAIRILTRATQADDSIKPRELYNNLKSVLTETGKVRMVQSEVIKAWGSVCPIEALGDLLGLHRRKAKSAKEDDKGWDELTSDEELEEEESLTDEALLDFESEFQDISPMTLRAEVVISMGEYPSRHRKAGKAESKSKLADAIREICKSLKDDEADEVLFASAYSLGNIPRAFDRRGVFDALVGKLAWDVAQIKKEEELPEESEEDILYLSDEVKGVIVESLGELTGVEAIGDDVEGWKEWLSNSKNARRLKVRKK